MTFGFVSSKRKIPLALLVVTGGLLAACSGGGGGSGSSTSTGGSTPPTSNLTQDQTIFQDFELAGGSYLLRFNMPYGGGNLVSGSNYFYSVDNALSHSPVYGPQTETPTVASLDSALALPTLPATRYLVNGKILARSASDNRLITYANGEVQISNYANDGATVVETEQLSSFTETSLSGNMASTPQALQSVLPISAWVTADNFSSNAAWQSGAAYSTRHTTLLADTYYVVDCPAQIPFVVTTGNSPTPCASGAALADIFPISLLAGSLLPYETDTAAGGSIVTVQGLTMWVANQPLPSEQSSTQSYRTYFELNGNVYMGFLRKNGTFVNTQQSDGSVVDYSIALNQAAAASIQGSLITGAKAGGVAVDSAVLGGTVDLFGIGGRAINGALAPADLAQHYNVPKGLNGAGQTVAVVDAPGSGDPSADLDSYSQAFGLPNCDTGNGCLTIDTTLVTGTATTDWSREIALDTQMVHAIAPGAKIILVIANSTTLQDILAAVNRAAGKPGVTAVSMSFSYRDGNLGQMQTEDALLSGFQTNQGIAFFASSGDAGDSQNGVGYPAASPFVTAVGGTTITSLSGGFPAAEVAWQYSSGGPSGYAAMPAWQSSFLGSSIANANNAACYSGYAACRAAPDVSAVADVQHSAVAVHYKNGWVMSGGTSAAAPIWAGISALVGQQRVASGKGTLAALIKSTAGGFNGLLYNAATAAGTSTLLHDVVSGSNDLTGVSCAVCSAQVGFDDVTGLGVPDVANLVGSL